MATTLTVADVLEGAANMIERDGWWNGGEAKPVGPCAAVAIDWCARVPEKQGVQLPVFDAALKAFGAALPPAPADVEWSPWFRVVRWNDEQESGEVVIAKLREVAKEVRDADGSEG